MHCPSCNRNFGFAYSFRILNPLRHKCPSCGAILTAGRFGRVCIFIGLMLGLAIAGVAIYMEERHTWSTRESLIWFAYAVPPTILLFQWFCWRNTRLSVRQ
jgi:hypothetical protein